jgi:hypothetical protein
LAASASASPPLPHTSHLTPPLSRQQGPSWSYSVALPVLLRRRCSAGKSDAASVGRDDVIHAACDMVQHRLSIRSRGTGRALYEVTVDDSTRYMIHGNMVYGTYLSLFQHCRQSSPHGFCSKIQTKTKINGARIVSLCLSPGFSLAPAAATAAETGETGHIPDGTSQVPRPLPWYGCIGDVPLLYLAHVTSTAAAVRRSTGRPP